MAEPLKNYYSLELIAKLAKLIQAENKDFDVERFKNLVFDAAWEDKALKQRMRHIVNCLNQCLPFTYEKQVDIFKKITHQFNGFTAMLFPDFVEVYGQNHFKLSIKMLEYFTQFSSSEFAVRPFILKYPKEMLKQHLIWSKSKNYHVRRLASEGIRPRLPWAMALPQFKLDPSPIIPILNELMNDKEDYVRRSVANCLNDISKDHPHVLINMLDKWQNQSESANWILKHASRGLLKKGNVAALNAFGLNENVSASVAEFNLNVTEINIGKSISFSFKLLLTQKTEAKLRVEYQVFYLKANGKHLPKVFQIGTYQMSHREVKSIAKNHNFSNLTTRKHYPGKHFIAIFVNGKQLAKTEFLLKP